MAQGKALEVWSGLPPWAKGIIAVGGLAIIYFTSRSIIKSINKKKKEQDDKDLLDATEREKRELERRGIKQMVSNAQLEAYSQKLVEAFNDCGTTESSVYTVFNGLKNQADLMQLIKIYGTRGYSGCLAQGEFGDMNYSLPRAIESELDTSETKKVNDILRKKGIDYTF
jgi:thiamine pyrophosphate-dependent acetolactate synthase large subunit-like protein